MRIDECSVRVEDWPLRTPFRIARGAKSIATVISVELRSGSWTGHGECCPYPRYGETVESIQEQLKRFDFKTVAATEVAEIRQTLLKQLPAGSARNALDCALWDLEAKSRKVPVSDIAGQPLPQPMMTCFTLSIDTPSAMAAAAIKHADCPLLKLKLDGTTTDSDRMRAVRDARPDARLVCDANESWQPHTLDVLLAAAADCEIELIEQPLPADNDAPLKGLASPVPICADESASPGSNIASLADRYQAVNIKLDKTGGLTAALAAIDHANRFGLKVMIGSMVSTSLSMAPAALLGASADWIDLDSPLLLARDRPNGMIIKNGLLSPPTADLWG